MSPEVLAPIPFLARENSSNELWEIDLLIPLADLTEKLNDGEGYIPCRTYNCFI
jgi:hypothetical protein